MSLAIYQAHFELSFPSFSFALSSSSYSSGSDITPSDPSFSSLGASGSVRPLLGSISCGLSIEEYKFLSSQTSGVSSIS